VPLEEQEVHPEAVHLVLEVHLEVVHQVVVLLEAARLGAVSRGRPMRRTCPTVGSTTITATSTAPMPGRLLGQTILTCVFSLATIWMVFLCTVSAKINPTTRL